MYRVKPIISGSCNWAFTLIDTPGFVDVEEHNLEILENIAETLTKLASGRVFGAIYFHNIAEGRLTGSSLSVLGIFKAICGDKFFPHVAFVTTMWDTVKLRHHANLEQVHKELGEGPMKVRGAPGIFKRIRDDDEGSKEVLRYFTLLARKRPTPPPLQLVRELRAETKNVGSTAAGRKILEDDRSGPTACCTVM